MNKIDVNLRDYSWFN